MNLVIEIARGITRLPYSFDLDGNTHHGASEELSWSDDLILTSGGTTNCVGYSTEVAIRALQSIYSEKLDTFSLKQIKNFIRHAFVVKKPDHLWGIASAIVELGAGDFVELDDLEPGDFGQFWHVKKREDGEISSYTGGHSLIFSSRSTRKGQPAFSCLSSTPTARDGWVEDTYLIERSISGGHLREWRFARLRS